MFVSSSFVFDFFFQYSQSISANSFMDLLVFYKMCLLSECLCAHFTPERFLSGMSSKPKSKED